MAWRASYVHVSCAYRDDIEMRSNAALYGTVESQYEEVRVPDKPRDGPIYD